MTPQRKIEILTLLRDKIEKEGLLGYGLCCQIWGEYEEGLITIIERKAFDREFMEWAQSNNYIDRVYAARPGEAQPRLDYLNKRIEELQKELANAQ